MRFVRENGLGIFFAVIFLATLAGQALVGHSAFNHDQIAHQGDPVSLGRYVLSSDFGVDVLDGIGSTEMLHIFLSNYPGEVKYGTTGKPVAGYDIRLLDDDGQVITGKGEMGELQVRGPTSASIGPR